METEDVQARTWQARTRTRTRTCTRTRTQSSRMPQAAPEGVAGFHGVLSGACFPLLLFHGFRNGPSSVEGVCRASHGSHGVEVASEIIFRRLRVAP